MSTYNGERYLREQLDSILNQEAVELELFIRDDGSTDTTFEILENYSGDKVHIYRGENEGYGKSFIDCLQMARYFDYYAFSDQDDFWEKEKLRKAIDFVEERLDDNNIPTVYYSNLKVSNAELKVIHITELENRNQTLESVSMRRSIAGCTMLLNQSLWKEIFKNKVTDKMLLQGHDSFIISLCYALGGIVYCDKNSYIRYRQHTSNTAGAPIRIGSRIKKEWKAFRYDKGAEAKIATAILNGWCEEIPLREKNVLNYIACMGTSLKSKLYILISSNFTTGDIRLTAMEKLKVLLFCEKYKSVNNR
jgi:rhamnosyltransferase